MERLRTPGLMHELLAIRKDLSRRARLILALSAWGAVVLVWFALTNWDILPPFSLPSPVGVLRAFARLWTEYDLLGNVMKSWWRIAQAFFWCAVIAIPLGLLMGSFRWVHDLVNPVAAPMRSMPITAFLPAFIALFGMEESMKVAFLWFGMFFYLSSTLFTSSTTTACLRLPGRWAQNTATFSGCCFARRSPRSSAPSASSMTSVGPT